MALMEDSAQLRQISDESLVDELHAVERQSRQIHSRKLELVAEMASRGVATKLGYSNILAFMVQALRITRGEARRRLAQAEDLLNTTTLTRAAVEASMPHTAAALAQGDVGVEHVEVIQKALKNMGHLDADQRAL